MRRAPFVITGTLVGLAGVLSFRSAPSAISLGALGTGATGSPATTTVAGASPPSTTTTTTAVASTPTTIHATVTTRPTATTSPTTTVAATVRSATGGSVNYFFGVLSVKVTASGTKITSVSIASLNDGGNPRSQSIDQQAIPMLIPQVMAAQGSHIQGVSGATYTSQGFYTSLLGALKQLGLK
jgi:uncharacterized protein with FMN-binding domain